MKLQVHVMNFSFLSRWYEVNFAFCATGAESQVISASMYFNISLELLPTSVGAYGLSFGEYDVTQHRMSHVLQVR